MVAEAIVFEEKLSSEYIRSHSVSKRSDVNKCYSTVPTFSVLRVRIGVTARVAKTVHVYQKSGTSLVPDGIGVEPTGIKGIVS
jgi:hypothetical protein